MKNEYLMFNNAKCFHVVVKADNSKQALRKFIKYVIKNLKYYKIEDKKFPTIGSKIDGDYIYCLELRVNKLYSEGGLYLCDYNNKSYVLLS